MKNQLIFIALFFSCFLGVSQEEDTVLTIKDAFIIDDSLKIIVWNTPEATFHTSQTLLFQSRQDTSVLHKFKRNNSLLNKSLFKLKSQNNEYTLYKTQYPLIHITTTNTIVDEPKVVAQLHYIDSTTSFTETIGIEWRGNISLTFPKKTFDIEFRKDTSTQKSKDIAFTGLREDDDYVLDGLYNEPLRFNAKLAQDLWMEQYALPYAKKEKKAKAGATGNFVELFLNNSYQGVYLLQDQVDRKSLQLKKQKNDTVRGVLYKAGYYGVGSKFEEAPDFNNALPRWAGFEMEYPYENYTSHWEPLYKAMQVATMATDEDFVEQITTHFSIDNCIEYFLFVNLTRATDNLGKNYYLARYKQDQPFFFVPWDLDGTFGTVIDGRKMNIVEDVLTNGLFERLWELNPNGYREKLSIRWKELRQTIYAEEYISKCMTAHYNSFTTNLLYEREALRWGTFFDTAALDYTLDWLHRRLKVLDAHFAE